VNTPLQPPLAVVDAINAAYAASTVAWFEHAGMVISAPQVNTTGEAAETVKDLVQVVVYGAQLLV
jgi:hypothetical protein